MSRSHTLGGQGSNSLGAVETSNRHNNAASSINTTSGPLKRGASNSVGTGAAGGLTGQPLQLCCC